MRGKRRIAWGLVAVAVALAALAWHLNLVAMAYYWARMKLHADEWHLAAIWLPDYRVTVEGVAVDGITDNASGLTYNPETGTLFTVINGPPAVVELTTEGRFLRRIPVTGVRDPEGITHVMGTMFVLVDERDHSIYQVRIDERTETLDVAGAPRLGLAIDLSGNLGFEGVSWDHVGERLFVAKEKAPLRVLVISGLPGVLDGSAFDLQIDEWKTGDAFSLFVSDLSSLTLHEATGHMLLMSDESALVVEYAPDGTPISMLPMWRGWHGLSGRVPQAEGLAIGPEGALYVLSEPNLFYRFERERPAD